MFFIIKKNKNILKVFNWTFGVILFFWLVGGMVYVYDSYRDQQLVFIRNAEVWLYASDDLSGPKVGSINSNDHVKVLRVLFKNEQLIIQVQTSNRVKGWLLKTNDIDLR